MDPHAARANSTWLAPQRALLLTVLFATACGSSPPEEVPPLFSRVPPERSGITFVNRIVEDEGFNVLEYEYFYNGGGVVAGDVNGDGLPDLFFTANAGPNRLYLNRGDFVFEDVTEQAGLSGTDATRDTGVGTRTVPLVVAAYNDGPLAVFALLPSRPPS
ncbi:VCBS repeat-containing protein [Rhodocaloribacter litoris]|uniref:FG-GAP repeat domain-containing protein n=1 Tax=Rhodocaloribacter litoris TaxID=2558931 RepID=UPI00142045DB|nr:VCBS repeat-containing protein [Rhodocaloribacter litoris]QXD14521.1 VCBS repeat-containing protein [Rhodocaloribacter litoris]